MAIYTDSLRNSWNGNDWSWGSTLNFSSSTCVHGGSSAISITITQGWAGLYLHHAAFNSSPYTNVNFWVHGGTSGGQALAVKATTNAVTTGKLYYFTPTAGTWQQVTVPLATLGVANNLNLDGIWIQSQSSSALSTFYVDDMVLATNANPQPTVTLTSPAMSSRPR